MEREAVDHSKMTKRELQVLFAETEKDGIDNTILQASIYKALRDKDSSPTEERWFHEYLLLVASGDLLPELYKMLLGSQLLMKKVCRYSKGEQQKIANCEGIATLDGGDERKIPLTAMLSPQVNQVCGKLAFRSLTEQSAYVADQRRRKEDRRAMKESAVAPKTKVKIDKRHKIVEVIGPISFSELLHIADQIRGKKREPAIA